MSRIFRVLIDSFSGGQASLPELTFLLPFLCVKTHWLSLPRVSQMALFDHPRLLVADLLLHKCVLTDIRDDCVTACRCRDQAFVERILGFGILSFLGLGVGWVAVRKLFILLLSRFLDGVGVIRALCLGLAGVLVLRREDLPSLLLN